MAFEKERAAHAAGKRIQWWNEWKGKWCLIAHPTWASGHQLRIHPDDDVDPYAEVRAAQAAGLRVELKVNHTAWSTVGAPWSFNEAPERYRIHPDDLYKFKEQITMNKTDALQRVATLERELAGLREIIEAPEPAPSLLTMPVPGSGTKYYIIEGSATRPLRVNGGYFARSPEESHYHQGNTFQSGTLASAYADAIETMLLLRHQPGTVVAKDEFQTIIQPNRMLDRVLTEHYEDRIMKAARLSPAFATSDDAREAINTVGPERILRMFKTLHHVED